MEVFEKIARSILGLVAHQYKDGSWEGMDTIIGTDKEVVGEAIERIEQGLGLTKCKECGRYEIPYDSPFCMEIPLCPGHLSVMVANADGTYTEVK